MLSFNSRKILSQFLDEDIGKGDITSSLLSKKRITARIISRENAIVAGIKYAKQIFEIKGCKVKILKKDGSNVKPNQTIMTITGNAGKILTCERTALNLLTRMSGIATQTNNLVKKIPNKKTRLYATRKTAPGLRIFDKEAVEIGGGEKHRLRLDEMVMIKDNHIAVSDSLESLIKKTKKRYQKFEVEVENTQDAVLAAKEGATIIMLDNFTPTQIKKTITTLKSNKLRDRVLLEASGGITSKNIANYGKTGVDIISVGSITNSVKGIDMSLEV
ncbi:carboxylating nicotinate-nucleotide diphosphorylase [Nitrosopumilus sp. K4]|uniref:carboxylating nicotinate-nucleotide diphosphorylase n=1 Tax=Nitrosopumilus sp. K4 TaxID=2795383 RepID=UPI001BA690A9|nr:carboxylating nicotinate-nucleotide diphosphorylase [Nitrosopumilus sp. K4]QUC65035.1 carboxylating nicotinate-nucleotide diphosphorylase [Nitrosopumilus sp. K4]